MKTKGLLLTCLLLVLTLCTLLSAQASQGGQVALTEEEALEVLTQWDPPSMLPGEALEGYTMDMAGRLDENEHVQRVYFTFRSEAGKMYTLYISRMTPGYGIAQTLANDSSVARDTDRALENGLGYMGTASENWTQYYAASLDKLEALREGSDGDAPVIVYEVFSDTVQGEELLAVLSAFAPYQPPVENP